MENIKVSSRVEAAPREVIALKAGDSFSYTYGGWTLTTPPPALTEEGHFPRSPTVPIQLQQANGAWLQSQTVTPQNYRSPNLLAVGTPNEAGYWATNIAGFLHPITLTVDMPTLPNLTYSCDVTLVLALAACLPKPSRFSVQANGQTVGDYSPTNTSIHPETITIPAALLKNGTNTVVISPPDDSGIAGIWVQSITAFSGSIPISGSYQWSEICSGVLDPNTSFTKTQTVTEGNTTTDAKSAEFGQEFGITATAGVDLFVSLSIQLSASFSYDESTEHSVSITKETSTTWGPQIGPAPETLTYQVWQLKIVYQAGGRQVVEALPSPILVRTYP